MNKELQESLVTLKPELEGTERSTQAVMANCDCNVSKPLVLSVREFLDWVS